MADLKKISFAIVGGTALIAGGIIGSSALLSRSSFNLKSTSRTATEKRITVKGVAEKEVSSDIGAFEVTLSCKSPDISSGYREMNLIREKLNKRMLELELRMGDIEKESIDYHPRYRTVVTREGNKSTSQEIFSHYQFTYRCRLVSKDVKTLDAAATKLYDLTSLGVDISVSRTEFFISNPEQYKLALVDAATNSAYQRAKIVAESCGSDLGPLLLARQGVIQITRPASNDTSDCGMYDTSTINKVMRLVMTLEFSLEKK